MSSITNVTEATFKQGAIRCLVNHGNQSVHN